jgi:hypothetical protein
MSVSVHLDFIPPNEPDLATLKIYEASAKDGPWTLIESVVEIGEYGSYISEYTTALATSATHWFSIEWFDSKGASFGQSQGVQGGVESLVSEIVDRVMLRDSSINELVAGQEAEALVEDIFSTDDPLSVLASDATGKQITGLTLLTIVRSKIYALSNSSSTSYTAGLVAQSGGSNSAKLSDLQALVDEANQLLGISFPGVIMQMQEICVAGGTASLPDQSRLLVDIL